MKKIITYLIVMLLLFVSCGSLYEVSDTKNDGIPFFTNQIIETTTVIYQEDFFQLELELVWEEIEDDAKKKSAKSKKIPNKDKKKFTTKAVKYSTIECGLELNNSFSSKKTIKDAYNSVFGQILKSPSQRIIGSECKYYNVPYPIKDVKKLTGLNNLIAGEISSRIVSVKKSRKSVPHPKKKYINIKKAVTGSSEATITLNENGTLASANAKTQDDLLGKIVDKLLITDVVSSFFGISDETETESIVSKNAKLVNIQLTLIPIKRNYEVSHEDFLKDNVSTLNIPKESNYTGFKVTESKGSLLNKVKPKKKEGSSIKINGEISIPKKSEK